MRGCNVQRNGECQWHGKPVLIGHQCVWCHMVFIINMEHFRQKSRLVAGDHMIEALDTIMYINIMWRETVIIALMIATLNDVKVKLGNILIAFVQAAVRENGWTTLGPEFGKDSKNTSVIVRA